MDTPVKPPPPHLVLIVDDNADVRDLVGEILRRDGYRTREASDGAEALDMVMDLVAAQDLPTVIVLDVMMPVMDGPTFIEQLRALGVDVPVVVLTASGRSAVLGASVVMAKPIHPEGLRDVVRLYASLPAHSATHRT